MRGQTVTTVVTKIVKYYIIYFSLLIPFLGPLNLPPAPPDLEFFYFRANYPFTVNAK